MFGSDSEDVVRLLQRISEQLEELIEINRDILDAIEEQQVEYVNDAKD